MLFLLGSMEGDHNRAIEMFKRAQEAIPFRPSPYLVVISLVSWSLSRSSLLVLTIRERYLDGILIDLPQRFRYGCTKP